MAPPVLGAGHTPLRLVLTAITALPSTKKASAAFYLVVVRQQPDASAHWVTGLNYQTVLLAPFQKQ